MLGTRCLFSSHFLLKERVSPEQLALLLKTEWHLSYVTPLYQFRHTQLKSYSRQLSAFIAAEKLQGMAVEVEGPQENYRVAFSVVEGMVGTDDDAETILVQVSKRPFSLTWWRMCGCYAMPVDLMLPDIVTWPNVTLRFSRLLHLLTDLRTQN